MARPRFIYSDELTRYDFGPTHPMAPGRVRMTYKLADQLGVLDAFDVVEPPTADDDLLRLVHDEDYIRAVRSNREQLNYGIGTQDNPLVVGMHHIASRICAATVAAAEAVWSGETNRAVNIAGGLHHAMPAGASGFCIYNDIAVAIRHLQAAGAKRIAYLDIDAHHGDGVQEIFVDDPSVLTISLHESPMFLFPRTGFATEIGSKAAEGSAVNVALPPETDDAGWLRAFEAVVPPVLEVFQPDILISQHGCDSHMTDPLTDLRISMDGLRESYLAVERLAERYAQGRWVALGGGGYSIIEAVPRAWTHLLAIVAGQPLDPLTPTPQAWRDLVGDDAPITMSDGRPVNFKPFSDGFDPSSRLDQAIMATRKAVYPELGLDPMM